METQERHPAPTDVDQVVAEIERMLGEGRIQEALDTIRHLLVSMKSVNESLTRQIADMARRLYGRRSEKRDEGPMLGFMEDLEKKIREQEMPPEVQALVEERGQGEAGREDLPKPNPKALTSHDHHRIPEDLPCEYVTREVAADQRVCRACRTPMTKVGTEVTTQLEYVPASFKKVVISRDRYECPRCDHDGVTAPCDQVIERGLPGPSLLAHIAVMKYQDHLPLNRISGIFARSGVDFATSTLSDWVRAVASALEPIYRCLWQAVMSSYVVGTDDTGLRVLDTRQPSGVKRGVMWVYVGDERSVVFQYTPNRSMEHPLAALSGRTGIVQCDAYAGYRRLAQDRHDILRAGCMAHVRRKAAEQSGDVRAPLFLDVIALMYRVEAMATEEGDTPESRLVRRQALTVPLMARFKTLTDQIGPVVNPKSPLGSAIRYTRDEWPALHVFLQDGKVPIDNNAVERAIRPVAVGRKNDLFAGSDQKARSAATLESVLGSCALVGAEPTTYLTDVLTRIANGWPHSRVTELLPEAWAENRRQRAVEPGGVPAEPGPKERDPFSASPLPSSHPP